MIGLYSANSQSALGFTGLLDEYGGAAAAYSVRRLSSSYSGSLIEVRRSSDNTTQDIGFDANGDLDTSALTTFVGAGDGFVRTWYDQSGNGNDAQQTTTSNQPQIVSSGSTILENGKAAIDFDGNDNLLIWNNITAPVLFQDLSDLITLISVESADVISIGSSIWFNGTTIIELRANNSINAGVPFNFGYSSNSFGYGVTDNYVSGAELESSSTLSLAQRIITSFVNGDSLNVFINSSSAINTTFTTATGDRSVGAGNSTLSIGSRSRDGGQADSNYYTGQMQEIIIYKSDNSASRSGIETNLNSYFSVYP